MKKAPPPLFIQQVKKKAVMEAEATPLPITPAYLPTLVLLSELLAVDVLVVASGLLCFLWAPDFPRASK